MQPFRLYRRTFAQFWNRLVNRARRVRNQRRATLRRNRGSLRTPAWTRSWLIQPVVSLEPRVLLATTISTSQATGGGDISYSDPEELIIAAGVTLSTSSSTGAAGTITLSSPKITIQDSVQLLATGGNGGADGAIQITANHQRDELNFNYWNLIDQTIPSSASIQLGNAVTIAGGSVRIEALAGDNLDWFTFTGSAGVDQILNGVMALPASVIIKQPTAQVSTGSTSITSSGSVTISSTTAADAMGAAAFNALTMKIFRLHDPAWAFAAGVAYADTQAITTIQAGTTITSQGSVSISSSAVNTVEMLAATLRNTNLDSVNPDLKSLAAANTISYCTSHALVAEGASITSTAGGVSVAAKAIESVETITSSTAYQDGTVGVGLAVQVAQASVLAEVDGSITAAKVDVAPTLTFNPTFVVDFAGNSLVFPGPVGFTTGAPVLYDAGPGGTPIPNLLDGAVYFAIVDSSQPNSLQLALTEAAALSGDAVSLGAGYPTLTTPQGTLPITQVNAASNTLAFNTATWPDGTPLFTPGQSVTFSPVVGQFLGYSNSSNALAGSLSSAANAYTVNVVNSSVTATDLFTIELLDSNGNVVDLNDNPYFTDPAGNTYEVFSFSAQTQQVNFNFPTQGTGPGEVPYPTPDQSTLVANLANATALVYTQGFGVNVTGLANGATYYAVVDPNNPGVIQLAASSTQAQAANPVVQDATPTLTTLQGQPLPATLLLVNSTTDSLTGTGSTVQNPVQLLWNTATGGSFTLSGLSGGASFTTGSLAWNATAADLQSALNLATGTSSTVSGLGTAATPWQISLPGGTSTLLVASVNDTLTGGSSTLQSSLAQQVWNGATAGSFVLNLNVNGMSVATAALGYNAAASDVAAAILAASGITATVTGTGTPASPWVITPTCDTTVSDFQSGGVLVFTTAPGLPDGTPVVYNEVTGRPIVGLTNGQTYYIYNQTNAAFQPNFPQYLMGLRATQDTSSPLVSWTFQQSFTDSDGNQYVVEGINRNSNVLSLTLPVAVPVGGSNGSGLTGGTVTVDQLPAGSLVLFNEATSGTFTLTVTTSGGGSSQTTPALDWNVSAGDLQSALAALTGVSDVSVSGQGTATSPWVINATGIVGLEADSSGLFDGTTAAESAVNTGTLLSLNATGGTFALQVQTAGGQTQTTTPLAWNASAATIELALNNLPGVAASVSGQGTAAFPWLLDVGSATLSLANNQLTGSTGGSTSTLAVGAQVATNATGGTFTLTFNPDGQGAQTTSALGYNATAAEVQQALTALGLTSVSVSGAGTVESPWSITASGLDNLAITNDTLTMPQAGTSLALSANGGDISLVSTTATGGTFTLSLTVAGSTLVSGDIDWNATASDVAAVLNAVPGVVAWVSGAGTASDPWVIQIAELTLATGDGLVFNDGWGVSPLGLLNGSTYYAVVQGPSSTPGSVQLQLAATQAEAQATNPTVLPLDTTQSLGAVLTATMSGTSQTLMSPMQASGISITASLEAVNKTQVYVQLGGLPRLEQRLKQWLILRHSFGLQDWWQGGTGTPAAHTQHAAANQPHQSAGGALAQNAQGGGDSPSFAGAGAGKRITHEVLAVVGGTANLLSAGSVLVSATIENELQGNVQSYLVKMGDGPLAVDTAVNVTLVNNTAQAIIHDGASVTGGEGVDVNAEVEYPWQGQFTMQEANSDDPDASPAQQWAHLWEHDTPALLLGLINDNLGADEFLTNQWTTAVAYPSGTGHQTPDLDYSISAVVAVTEIQTTTVAQIEAGAQINQQNAELSETPLEQPVSVGATTDLAQVALNGVVRFDLGPDALLMLYRKNFHGATQLAGGESSAGGTVGTFSTNTRTVAVVGETDLVHAAGAPSQPTNVNYGTGANGGPGLNISAETTVLGIQMTQSGAGGDNFGFMGAAGVFEIDRQQTFAGIVPVAVAGTPGGSVMNIQPNAGATSDVNVSAEDVTVVVNLVGGVLTNAEVGIGVSSAVTLVDEREVIAQIGTGWGDSPLQSAIAAGGDIQVSATAGGTLTSVALASSTNSRSAQSSGGAGGGGGPQSLPVANHGNPDAANGASGSFGMGLSGDVALSIVYTTTQAVINDTGTIASTTPGNTLSLKAADTTTAVQMTGAYAAQSQQAELSLGLAGSVALAFATSDVLAGWNAATVTGLGLDLAATTDVTLISLAAGGMGPSAGTSSVSVVGSIAYNYLASSPQVLVTGATGTGLLDVSGSAVEDSLAIAVAGTLNLPNLPETNPDSSAVHSPAASEAGVKIGVGLAGSINAVTTNAVVQVSDSSWTQTNGTLTLSAESTPSLYAFASGISVGSNQQNVALGGQFTDTIVSASADVVVAQNSQIASTSSTANTGLSLVAILSPMVVSGAGGLLYSVNGNLAGYAAAGAAVTNLTVDGSANTQIDASNVHLTSGDVQLVTTSGPPPEDNQQQLDQLGLLNLPLYEGDNNFYSFAVGADVSGALVDGDFSMTFNTITSWDLSAQVTNGSGITVGGDVVVLASDDSEIISGAGSLVMVLTPGQEEGHSVSLQAAIGAAVTQNTVTASVIAQIANSTITATGTGATVTVEATSARLISTGAAGGEGVSGEGEGGDDAAINAGTAVTVNTIDSTVTAQITGITTGSGAVTAPGGITVKADDASQIGSGAGQIDLSLLLKEGTPGFAAIAAAAAAAVNTLDQTVTATVNGATLHAPAGNVEVTANAGANVLATAVGVAFTLTTTGGLLEFDGAGSGTGNTVSSSVLAEVVNSTVSSGALVVTATDDTAVEASAGTLAIQITPAGGQALFSAAMGISMAGNTLGSAATPNRVLAEVVDSTLSLTGQSANGLALEVSAGSTVDCVAATAAGAGQYDSNTSLPWTGVGAQSLNAVFQAVNSSLEGGTATVTGTGGVAITANNLTTSNAGAGGLAFAGYTGHGKGANESPLLLAVSVGAALAGNAVTLETSALIGGGAGLQFSGGSPGPLSVESTSAATIESVAVGVAGVLSLSDESTFVNLGGAGSSAVNEVSSTVAAQIEGTSTEVTGPGSVVLEAVDQNSVVAGSGAVSFAGGLKVDVTISVGVSLSDNTIDGSVAAGVVGGATLVTPGVATISAGARPATSQGNAYAVAVAGAGALSVDGLESPLVAAGAGAGITNTIAYSISSGLNQATVSAGSLALSASDDSVLYSNAGGVGLTLGSATGAQAGLVVGAAQGTNTVANSVQAQIVDSTVNTAANLSVDATSQATIESIAYGVALGLEAVDAGASAAGSGAAAYNTVTNTTVAGITGGSVTTAGLDGTTALQVSATDESTITASAGAGGMGGLVGDGAGLAVGVAIAENTIHNTTQAYVGTLNPPAGTTPSETMVSVTGPVTIAATSSPAATSLAVAVAASTDIGEGAALAGAGANAITTLGPASAGGVQVLAGILAGASVSSQPGGSGQTGVSVQASHQPAVTSNVGTGAGTIGLFGASVGVSLGTITDNTTVLAVLESATVEAAGGAVSLQTSSNSQLSVEVVPTSVSISLGAAGAGGNASINNNAQYQVQVVQATAITADTFTATATSHDSLTAQIIGVDFGAASIGAFLASANRGGETSVEVNLPASLDVTNLALAAQTQQTVETEGSSVSVGLFSGAGETLTSTLTERVSAQLLNPTAVTAPLDLAGTFQINAVSNNSVLAHNGIGSADVSVSTLGVGVYQSFATSAPTVGVLVEGVEVEADGPILVFAEATSVTTSQTRSGTGSLLSGMASEATTTNNPTVSAQVNGGSLQTSGQLQFLARNTSQYNLLSDSTNAALIGGSGTVGTNNGTANVTTSIDADTTLVGQQGVLFTAYNTFESVGQQPSVLGGAGGAADTNTAKLNTNLAANVSVEVGEAAAITGNGSTGVQIAALTNSNINESAQISTGGLLENTNALTNLTLNFTPSVQVSPNAQINAPQGSLGIGTMANVLASSGASGTTYGVAGIVVSNSTVDVTVNPDIVIGTGASLAGNTVAVSTDSLPLLPYSSLLAVNSQAYANTGTVVPIWEHSASATVNSNGTVTIGTGATLTAQQDVLLEANPLQAVPSASIIGKTLYTSAKRKTGDTATNLTGLLTLDGTVVAGSVNTLDIEIDNYEYPSTVYVTVNGQTAAATVEPGLGRPTPAITPNSSATSPFLPFSAAFDPNFNAQSLLTGLSAANLGLVSGFVSSTPMDTLQLSNVQAAGGQVVINAAGVQGSGTVEANLPRVSVVNALPIYLVLDEVDLLAGIDSGKISFTGTASSAPGLTLRPFANGVTTPELNVQLTSTFPIGTTSEGASASLFVTGPVNNMLGSVDLSVANGSLIQQAPINATSITIDVPNGVFFVDGNPPIPYEGVAGDIQDAWLNVASSNVTATAGNNQYGSESQTVPTVTSFFLPGLTSSGYSPNLVVTTAVDSRFNPNGTSQSAFYFTQQHVVGTTSNTTNGTGTSYIYFGDAMPYLWGTGNDDGSSYAGTQAQTGSNSNFLTNSSNGLTYTIGSGNNGMGNTPLIMPNLPLTATGTTAAPAAQNLTGSINAAAVSITAGIIDLNGPMNVGHTVNAQVTLSPGLGLLLRQYQTAYDSNPGTVAAIYNIPASLLPEAISASYNCLTGAITVGPIVAAPDVEVILTGQMISSVTGAAINLSGGLGNCQVDNQTGLPVVLAGVGSGPTSTQGTVTINDTWANQTTIYTYSPGEPVQVYSGTLNQVTPTGTPTSSISGTTATFQPTDNTLYTWTNAASVSRPGNDTSTTPATWGYPAKGAGSFNYSGDWTFYSGTADAPYVASQGTLSVSSSANPAVFSEQVSATINQSYSLAIQYNSNASDSYGFGSNFTQTYIYPYDITVTATSSILVDNPVAINFGGITGGTLAINSNANVILGGSVALVGAVTAQVNGSLLQQSSAVLSATSLDLNAVGGTIGIAAQPLTVAMIGSGAVSATGSEGVYLASTGDLVIDTISTQQASGVTVSGGTLISGFGQNGTGWTLVNGEGDHASIEDNVLSLTQAGSTDTANAAWFDTPLAVNQPFAVGFSYQGQANGADGVALVFQNSSSGTSAVGSAGGGVGYAGIGNSLALVLDIYSGNGANGSGMAIATNGASWALTNTGPVALDSSHLIDVVFSYDPVAQTVTVVLTDTVNGDQYTSVTTGIDLATITGGNTATLGFTGGDGGTTSNQSVRNFTLYSISASSTAQGPVVGMGTNGSGWNLANNGGATATISNNLLTLTTAGTTNTANAAWYGTPVRVDQPFAVTYTYTGQANGADGVAFVLQNDGRGTSAVGTVGGGVGYADIVSSVAVILDIYSDNGAEGAGFQFATQGNIGASSFSSTSPVALNSGHPIEVSLVFNPLTETLNVTLVDTITGQLFTSQQTNVNIAQIVGANTAILGFTGGDGGTTSTQTIGDFQYQPLQSASFQTGNAGWNSVASSGAVTPSILNNAVTVTTQAKPNSATALWYGTPLPVASSFQVDFTYTGQAGGDQGLALVFQNDPSGLTALGSAGTGYGYAGIQNSVGLLLGIGGGSGTALATDGVIPPLLPTGSVNLASGHPIAVSLVYNAQQNLLVQTLTDTVTNQTFTTSYTQSSLADVLLGQSAYVGFTGGTATNGSNQSVSNFSIVTLAQAPIVLSAHGSLLAASSSSLVQGNILVLEAGAEAITGTIGTATTPLPIQITAATGLGGSQSGSLSATAPGDITLVANSGNIVVDSIVSTQGDVSLTAGAGSIVSASGLTSLNIPMDVLSGAQLQQMLAEINQLAQTSTAATVDSFEATVNQLYTQYWGILGNSTFTANNLTANGGTLTGGGITVQPLTPGQISFSTNATGGVFYLALTNTQGVQGTTTALAWNSTAAQVAAAVNSLQDANGNNLFTPLTVTGSGTAADPWILSGQSVANLTGTSAALTGGTLSLGAPTPGSVPVFVTASAGTFTLTLTNPAGATGTTAALAWNSTASQVAAALAALTTTGGAPLATGLTVSGSGTANDPWIVAGEALVSLTANGTALAGAALTLQPLTQASIPLSTSASGGTFTLTVTNTLGTSATTVPLDWNSPANEVALALNGLTDASGNSLVSGLTVTGAGTAGNPWVVSGATCQYVFNNTGLTGGTGTVGAPTAASVQLVSPVATGGTFTLSLQTAPTGTTQTTGSLAWNATASQLAAALNALPGVSGMTVTGAGTAASPWIITGPALSVGYVLNSDAYSYYQPMVQAALNLPAGQSATATQTQQVISGMAQNCVNMFVNPIVFGSAWASLPQFVAYDPNYQFVATPTQIADLTYGATYGFPDLAVLEVDALTPFNPDAVTEPVQPQIVGQNIILSATGSVGLVNQTTVITLEDIQNQTLTASQQSSLALATSSGGPLLMVGTRSTGEQVTYTYGNLPAGVTPLGVQAQLDVPLFVDLAPTGTLSVQGNSQVAVTEVSGDLNLASAVSSGPVHLTADGSVVAGTPAAPGMVSGTALSGFGTNGTGWKINTNATSTSGFKATINNNQLTLTNSAYGSTANAVWYDAQVLVANGFTVTFDYQVNTTTGADGVAFVIQNSTAGLAALGGSGGGLGYSGISQSLAVALDIYSGNGVNGSGLQVATNGTLGSFGGTSPVQLNSAAVIPVTITYNAQANTLEVTLQEYGKTFTQTFDSIDLESLLGQETGWIGFTGGDGGVTSTQTISNFALTLPVSVVDSISGIELADTVVPLGTDTWAVVDNGGFTPTASNGVLTLTKSGIENTASAAWYGQSVSVTSPFEAQFTYTGQSGGADGVAFVLQNSNQGLAALGGPGGGVGYSGISNSLAFILDIYSGGPSDGSGIQIAQQGLVTNTYLTPGSVQLDSGDPIDVFLTYNPGTQTLAYTLTNSFSKKSSSGLATGINLSAILGSGLAMVGFTGGDGGVTSTQTISNFNFVGGTTIIASSLDISTGTNIGQSSTAPLTINMSGEVNLYAGGSLWISQPAGTLTLGQVQAIGSVNITAAGSVAATTEPGQGTIASFSGTGSGWDLAGSAVIKAAVNPTDSDLQLAAANTANAASAAWYPNPVLWQNSFSTGFVINPISNPAGLGVTFTLQNDSRGTGAVGGSGASLGYGGTNAIQNSVSVQLQASGTQLQVGLGSNGQLFNLGQQLVANVNLADPLQVILHFDSTAGTLGIQLINTTTGATPLSVALDVDLLSILNSGTALMGFTGASTGGSSSALSVTNFYFAYGAPNVTAADLNISAGGSIGSAAQPLVSEVPGSGEVTLSATGNITLLALVGDLNVGTITAGGTATLLVPDGSVVASSDPAANPMAVRTAADSGLFPTNVRITAQALAVDARDSVGTLATPLITQVSELRVRAATGDVALSNLGALRITGAGRLPGVEAGESVQIDTTVGLRVEGQVNARMDVGLNVRDLALAGQSLVVATNASIESALGRLELTAPDQLQFQPGSRLVAAGGLTSEIRLALNRQTAGVSAAVIQSQGQVSSDRLSLAGAIHGTRFELNHAGLQGVTGIMAASLQGTESADLVLIDDLQGSGSQVLTLSDTSLVTHTVELLHAGVESFVLELGQFADAVTIDQLTKVQQVDVRAQGGDDQILVRFVAGGTAAVLVDGGSGVNSLTYDGAGQPMWVKPGGIQSLTAAVAHKNLRNITPRNIAALNGNPYASNLDVPPLLEGLTATQRYVQVTYLQILQRVATPAELNQWTTYINQAPTDLRRRSQLVDTLSATDAARTLLLQAWFQAYAGRPALPAEITTWLATFRSVSNPQTVQQRFLNSAPVYDHLQTFVTTGTPDQRYVGGLWQLLVDPGTPTSGSTLALWLNQQTQLGRAKMTANMLGHLAYVSNQSQAFTQLINQKNAPFDELLARGPALVTISSNNLLTAKVISPFELWRWLLTNRTA